MELVALNHRAQQEEVDGNVQDESDEADMALQQGRHLMTQLQGKLRWHVNLPSGVGSGRADVRYKAHALLHGERLMQPTWKSAALARTLGTESRIGAVSMLAEDLFGAWIHDGCTDAELVSQQSLHELPPQRLP